VSGVNAVNSLAQQYPEEIAKIMAKYPAGQKRSAIMPLLFLAQRKTGYITRQTLNEIADLVEMTSTEVASIIGFYTLFHDEQAGRYRIQVCTDLSCALSGADEFMQKLCQNLGIRVGETTPDGLITIEEVTCLAGCDKGPLFQLQGDGEITYHENQTVDSAMHVIADLRTPSGAPKRRKNSQEAGK
jgi:NADH-quinone oxidoreductase subunit E